MSLNSFLGDLINFKFASKFTAGNNAYNKLALGINANCTFVCGMLYFLLISSSVPPAEIVATVAFFLIFASIQADIVSRVSPEIDAPITSVDLLTYPGN